MELSPQAWGSLRAHALRGSLEKIRANLRVYLPAETSGYSDDELYARLDLLIDEADKYHLTSEQQIFVYSAAVILYGPLFERSEESVYLNQLLNDPRHDGEMKAMMLKLRIALDTGHQLP